MPSPGGDAWILSLDLNPDIDFCVSVLQEDGLRADPFNGHPEGSKVLRSAGLKEAGWREWLQSVVAEQRALTRSKDANPHDTAKWKKWQAAPELWNGDSAVGWALGDLWHAYQEAAATSRKGNAGRLEELTKGKNYRRVLKPYQSRLPGLRVYVVGYPDPVVLTFKPDTALLGLGHFDSWDFESQLLEAAEALVAH